jgi:hypothetical protein
MEQISTSVVSKSPALSILVTQMDTSPEEDVTRQRWCGKRGADRTERPVNDERPTVVSEV